MFKFNYIREFIILAETLNFSRTAEIAYITQPALSRHIAILEEEMGARLVERTTRNVVLTRAGEAVYKAFREIWQIWDISKESAAFLAEGKQEVLTLNSPYYWTEDFTEPIVNQFLRHYPDCDVRIISCQPHQGFDDLNDNRSDIFISYYQEDIDSAIRRIPFAVEPLCVVCLKDHPLAERESMLLKELEDRNFVFLGYGNPSYKQHPVKISSLLSRRNIYPDNVSYTQQIDTLGITMLKTGYISIMPYGARHLDRSYLRFIPLLDEDCQLQMCLYYRTDNPNTLIPRFIQEAKHIRG